MKEKDLSAVFEMYRTLMTMEPDEGRVRRNTSRFPSLVAELEAGEVIGFAFSTDFAPDILELANILVVPEYRNLGLGQSLVKHLEQKAIAEGFRTIILVNSLLYPSSTGKRSAESFYKRLGYRSIPSTESSKVYARHL